MLFHVSPNQIPPGDNDYSPGGKVRTRADWSSQALHECDRVRLNGKKSIVARCSEGMEHRKSCQQSKGTKRIKNRIVEFRCSFKPAADVLRIGFGINSITVSSISTQRHCFLLCQQNNGWY